ncbi:MAG: hypothetical protein DCC49_09600 [Acidobacteria bacterium]|nr:MAG: hypothetical protein DCC49_09600 [Acidobacteriota bacterium]
MWSTDAMTPETFVAQRQAAWGELRALLSMSSSRRQLRNLGGDKVRRMADLYREVAADLAIARLRFPALAPELADLVRDSHAILYQPRRPKLRSVLSFLTQGFPRLVRSEWRIVTIGIALLMGPFLLAMVWGIIAPNKAEVLLPEVWRGVARDGPTAKPISPGIGALAEGTLFFTSILVNNVRVGFLTFAGGVLFGVGAGFVLVSNGMLFGALTGISISHGHGLELFALTTAHGVLELSAISIAGAAGTRMGWSLVDPGPVSRSKALAEAAGKAVRLIVGVSVALFFAALVEGYVTPSSLFGPWGKIGIGIAIGAAFWAYIVLAGREAKVKDADGPLA